MSIMWLPTKDIYLYLLLWVSSHLADKPILRFQKSAGSKRLNLPKEKILDLYLN